MNMKKIVALMLTMVMFFTVCVSEVGAVLSSALARADGNAYFYFWASDLKVEAPKNFKVGYLVNGSDPIYFTNNFPSRTERIEKAFLKPGKVNTFTLFTGDTNGMIDETLSRQQAGTNCDDFSIITTALNLVLPDGRVVFPSKVLSYFPKDATTPLKDAYNVIENKESRIYLGDNTLSSYYKMDVQFDLTGISWSDEIPDELPGIKNVALQIGADPSSRNLVWYSTSTNASVAQLALKSDMTSGSFPENKQIFSAASEETGLTSYKSYKTTMTNLCESTEYVYRVGNETDGWSEIYSFKTTDFSGDFGFLAVADPQLGQGQEFQKIQDEITSWNNTVTTMNTNFSDAAFLACLGDQVSESCIESEFDAFLAPDLLKSYALSIIPGNHDYDANYTPRYNMPNVSSLGVHNSMGKGSGDYYYTYNNALFMVLNGRCYDNNEHIQFMEETMKKHPDAKWKIVMIHEGLYGATDQSTRTDYIRALREELTAPLAKFGIDIVLDGHEHCYSRSYMINDKGEPNLSTGGNSVTDPDPNEVAYITLGTATGTDYVVPLDSSKLPCVAKIVGDETPKFTKVDITDSSLTVRTYRVSDMELVDTFSINRTKPVVKSLFISPENVVVKAGTSQQFSTEIYGCDNPSEEVIWSVSDAESERTVITQQGVLSIDANETAETLTVTATSVVNPSKFASATVSVGSTVTTVNVGLGVTYMLPKTIDGVSVSWANSDGTSVQYADTSKVGYRFYTATLADSTEVKYRINVGEYITLMEDDFEKYTEDQYQKKVSQSITGGTFNKGAYAQTNDAQQLLKDGTNTVAAFGPEISNLNSFRWTPTDKAKEEAFKLSYHLRVNSIDLDTVKNGSSYGYLFSNNFDNASGVQLRVVVENGKITKTQLRCNGTSDKYADISNLVKWTSPDDNNVVSMEDYITIELEGNNVQYTAKVNNTEIAESVPWSAAEYIANGVQAINMAKRSWGGEDAVTYIDNMEFSKAVYVTDNLKKIPVTQTLYRGDATAQTAVVALKLSDGSTKDFIVNYVADTATEGVKTAVGKIDGFDTPLTVTYTVKPKMAVNVGLGVKYLLPKTIDGTSVTWKDSSGATVQYADTSKVGYRFYTGTLADSTEIMYRVNVGEYVTLMEDDFESYSESQYKTAVTQNITGGYFYKTACVAGNDDQQLTKDGSNTVAAFGPISSEPEHFKWVLGSDKAKEEAFKLSYQLRVNSLDLDTVKKGGSYGYLFSSNFHHTSGIQLRVIAENGNITQTQLRCNGVPEKYVDISNLVKWTAPNGDNVVSMEEYITIELEGNNLQYAAKVNGTVVADSIPWSNAEYIADGVQAVNMAKRSWGGEVATTYLDNMEFSKAVYVTDSVKDISAAETVYYGEGSLQTAAVALKMSDGSTKNFTVNYVADTATEGVKIAVGKIDGFDESIMVTYTVVIPTEITEVGNNSEGKTQVKLLNNIVLDAGTKVFAAVYDKTSGAFKKVAFADLDETQRNIGAQTVPLSEDFLTVGVNCRIKVFVWNSQLKPLAEMLEITK